MNKLSSHFSLKLSLEENKVTLRDIEDSVFRLSELAILLDSHRKKDRNHARNILNNPDFLDRLSFISNSEDESYLIEGGKAFHTFFYFYYDFIQKNQFSEASKFAQEYLREVRRYGFNL